eukprot:10442043-Alexandrium_andersonii.AAC.1
MGRADNLRARDQTERAGVLLLAGPDHQNRGNWQRDLTQDGDVEPEPGPVSARGARTHRWGPGGRTRDFTQDGD